MKVEVLLFNLLIVLFAIVTATSACVSRNGGELIDEEVGVPGGEAYIFNVKIHRVAHVLEQGVSIMIEEQAEIEMLGEGDSVYGIGRGSAQFISMLDGPCQMTCNYEIIFKVIGSFNAAPMCNLELHFYPETLPGECVCDCTIPGYTIHWPGGITDVNIAPVIFEASETGLRIISRDKVLRDERLGNTQWTSTYEVTNFIGEPYVEGCDFNFRPPRSECP